MNVLIISSSRDEINDKYKNIARNIASLFARNNYNLVFGGSSTSMMGICYQEFLKENREIYAYTTDKYVDDLKNLNKAKQYLCRTTFDLKKEMFEKSDMIICLPGGIGTISELLSYIEEKRSNDKKIPIIIFDEEKFYFKLNDIIEDLIKEKFVCEDIYNTYDVVTNLEELKEYIER